MMLVLINVVAISVAVVAACTSLPELPMRRALSYSPRRLNKSVGDQVSYDSNNTSTDIDDSDYSRESIEYEEDDESSDVEDYEHEEEEDSDTDADAHNQIPQKKWWESDTLKATHPEPFAKGGFGKAYRGILGQSIPIVIKVINVDCDDHDDPNDAEKERQRRRASALLEFQRQKSVDSEHVVKMMCFLESSKLLSIPRQVALIMEDGGVCDLRQLYDLCGQDDKSRVINDPASRVARVKYIGWSMIKAVHALHDHKIIHRDISPKNFTISPTGAVKLIDLGLSVTQDTMQVKGRVGTDLYMAGPVVLEQPYDQLVDIYGCGMTMLLVDQLEDTLASVVQTEEDLYEWHRNRGDPTTVLSDNNCDPMVIKAVQVMCHQYRGRRIVIQGLALWKDVWVNGMSAPHNVVQDVHNHMRAPISSYQSSSSSSSNN